MTLTQRRRRISVVPRAQKPTELCRTFIQRRKHLFITITLGVVLIALVRHAMWLSTGGHSRVRMLSKSMPFDDDYFEDFEPVAGKATTVQQRGKQRARRGGLWMTNTDNVLVSEGAGAAGEGIAFAGGEPGGGRDSSKVDDDVPTWGALPVWYYFLGGGEHVVTSNSKT